MLGISISVLSNFPLLYFQTVYALLQSATYPHQIIICLCLPCPRWAPSFTSASINTFTHLFLGYHKNILIKFHIFRHNDIVSFFTHATHTARRTFDSTRTIHPSVRPTDRNTDIKRTPLIIQITHTSSLPTVPSRAPLCLQSSPLEKSQLQKTKGNISEIIQ